MVKLIVLAVFVIFVIYTMIIMEFLNAPSEESIILNEIRYLKSLPQTKEVKLKIQKLQQQL